MRRLAAILACTPLIAVAASTPDIPRTLVHSGRLLGGNDQPMTGTQTITFRFFPDLVAPPGEKPLWTEKYTVQVDANGVYSLELGAPIDATGAAKTAFPADLFQSGTAFLEIAIGEPPQTLSPRQHVGAVPFAMTSGNALALGGKDPSQWQGRLTPTGPISLDSQGNLGIATAGAGTTGALSAADWSTFNAKQDKLTPTGPLALDAGARLSIATADANTTGALSAADWSVFKGKQDRLTPTGPISLDSQGNLGIALAGTNAAGALSAADWNTFNGKQDRLAPVGPVTIDGTGHIAVSPAKPGTPGLLASVAAPLALDASGNLSLSTGGFIANGTTAQAGASLNIGGSATVGSLNVGGAANLVTPITVKSGAATRFAVDNAGNTTVAGTITVAGSSTINAAQNAGVATFEYPFQYTVTVGGDPNTFYPVALRPASNGLVPGKIVIARTYFETAPITSSTPDPSHLGGLQAVFTTMNTAWADYNYLTLEHYRQTYVRTIADCGMLPAASNGHELWCRLRGGGFVYHLWANYDLAPIQPAPNSEAYNDPGGPYLFKYPPTLAAGSAPNNAFAPGGSDVPVSAY